MEKSERLEIEVYNRIHEWGVSLHDAQCALNLCNYLNQELFSEERCLPYDLAFHSRRISFDFPAVYYMRVFNEGRGLVEKMCSNHDERAVSIRNDMLGYVRSELKWTEEKWKQFQDSISDLRNQVVVHFDANRAEFEEDARGYALMHPLMKPEGREELGAVVSLMRQFITRYRPINE